MPWLSEWAGGVLSIWGGRIVTARGEPSVLGGQVMSFIIVLVVVMAGVAIEYCDRWMHEKRWGRGPIGETEYLSSQGVKITFRESLPLIASLKPSMKRSKGKLWVTTPSVGREPSAIPSITSG